MPNMKLIELIAIEKNEEKTYLHIRLTAEYEIELLWNIDNTTARNLLNIYECNSNYKYRISLNSTYDKTRNQYESSLSKTYRDISKPIFFDCSVDYVNCLESIKNSKSVTDLKNLPFIFSKIPVVNEATVKTTHEPKQIVAKKRLKVTFGSLVAIISMVLIITAGSSHQLVRDFKDSGVVVAAQPITYTPAKLQIEKDVTLPVISTSTIASDSIQSSLNSITTDDSITYSIPDGYVALTFDDGPSKYTKEITDILIEYQVGGTFFFLGKNAKRYPDMVRYVQENGYSIGNHSMSHPNMTELTIEEQTKELLQTTEILEAITNEKVVLFRPPYGALNEQVTDLVQSHLYKIVYWNKDPKDWNTRDSDKIFNYVRDNKASGSIILFHESQTVIDALPEIIEILQGQNLKLVSLQ